MNIALIDDDIDYIHIFKDCILDTGINVDHYLTSLEFRNVPLNKYSIIFSDYHLPGITGYELLTAIAKKTKARLALISSSVDNAKEEIIKNKDISYVFDKWKCKEIASWVKHVRKRVVRDLKFEKHIKSLTQVSHKLESKEK